MNENNLLETARNLLEVISPDPDTLDEAFERLEEHWGDLSFWALQQAAGGSGICVCHGEDIGEFIEGLTQLASAWHANLFLGHLEDDDRLQYYALDADAILQIAARELEQYALILWRWAGTDDDVYFTFVSTYAGADLVERYANQLGEKVYAVLEDE